MSEPSSSAPPEAREPSLSSPPFEVPSGPIADLADQGDVEGLLALAQDYRTGDGEADKDLSKCLDCYLAAAELGDAEGAYAGALFHITGMAVERDVPRGVSLLRKAAGQGHLDAKVYLGNIYYLGIHYEPDDEKADVWYRSAARAAGVEHEPDTVEFTRAMAEVGAARECDQVLGDSEIPKEDRVAFLRKAKALGLGEFKRQQQREKEAAAAEAAEAAAAEAVSEERPSSDSLEIDEAERAAAKMVAARAATADGEKKKQGDQDKKAEKKKKSSWTVGAGLLAFIGATVFFSAAAVAGYFATPGVEGALPEGLEIPVLVTAQNLCFTAALVLFGLVPTFFLYRAGTVIFATFIAAAAGAGGFFLHLMVVPADFLAERPHQAIAFAVGGYLLVAFFAGLRGGTRRKGPDDDEEEAPK